MEIWQQSREVRLELAVWELWVGLQVCPARCPRPWGWDERSLRLSDVCAASNASDPQEQSLRRLWSNCPSLCGAQIREWFDRDAKQQSSTICPRQRSKVWCLFSSSNFIRFKIHGFFLEILSSEKQTKLSGLKTADSAKWKTAKWVLKYITNNFSSLELRWSWLAVVV